MPAEELPHLPAERLSAILDPARTALLLVDVQVDFASPEGALGAKGVDMTPAGEAIDRMEPVITAARNAGATVGFIQVATTQETDSRALKRLYERKGRPASAYAICREGTAGVEPYRLVPQEGDFVLRKRQFDPFHDTDLLEILNAHGIETVVIMGLTTDCCVDQTARTAFHHNFDVFVVSDACAAYAPAMHFGALQALEKNCALLVRSGAVVEALQHAHPGTA